MDEETPLLKKASPAAVRNGNFDAILDDDTAAFPIPVIDLRHHEKSVSLLLEDAEDHVFRIVEPGDSLDDDEDDDDDDSHLCHSRNTHSHRSRTDSHGSILEMALESITEVKETIVDVLHEEVSIPIKPREEGDHSQKLSAMALAMIVFYKVSGGPFGCEPAVRAAGPFYALMGFALFPILWSIPEALITAELGSAYPEPSGCMCRDVSLFGNGHDIPLILFLTHHFSLLLFCFLFIHATCLAVAWVEEAFGPKASLLCGYFHWISGATDNAIYPSLFLKYIASYMHSEDFMSSDMVRFLFTVAITLVLATINYSGLHIVGNLSILVSIISMSPFVIMCILAIPKLEPSRWLVLPEPDITTDDDGTGILANPAFAGVHWRPLLNSLFWNLNSFDVGASFAGEVRDPERVFPRAMFLSVIFVVLSYLLPLLAALGAVDTRQEDWNAGYFTAVSVTIGGTWLGAYTVVASAISNIALFEAEMSGDAYQLMGMGDRGLIPKWFTKRSRYGTPVNGIVVGTLVIILMSVADFDELVEMLNFAYSLSLLMELAAFIKLRITDGDGTYACHRIRSGCDVH